MNSYIQYNSGTTENGWVAVKDIILIKGDAYKVFIHTRTKVISCNELQFSDDPLVGYLNEGKFWCIDCIKTTFRHTVKVPVYLSNIRPYSQKCKECNAICVEGAKNNNGKDPLELYT